MANTVNRVGRVIQLTAVDTDWLLSDLGLSQSNIESVEFRPGATLDILVIKEGSATGPAIASLFSTSADTITKYLKGRHDLFLDVSDCTLSAGHSITIILGQ